MSSRISLGLDAAKRRRWWWRRSVDNVAQYLISAGGLLIIGAIVLICFYLLWVVLPIFRPATITVHSTSLLDNQSVQRLFAEEHGKAFIAVGSDGAITSDDVSTGSSTVLRPADNRSLRAVSAPLPTDTLFAVVGADNRISISRAQFAIDFPDGQRTVTPSVATLLADYQSPLRGDIMSVAVNDNGDHITLAAIDSEHRLAIASFSASSNLFTGATTLQQQRSEIMALETIGQVDMIRLHASGEQVYARANGNVLLVIDTERLRVSQQTSLPSTITAMALMAGGTSVLVGMDNGTIQQFFAMRDGTLQSIRAFRVNAAVQQIFVEPARRVFAVISSDRMLTLFHTTAEQRVGRAALPTDHTTTYSATFSPYADRVLLQGNAGLLAVDVNNPYPEISLASLWKAIWYENYDEPEYVWQSSAGSSDFEPKYSLIPLTFGTIKAALYAMLFSIPLALAAALYTGQFASPQLRSSVKPAVEVMEALPTVILGFLAGLWLAPIVENDLPAVILSCLFLPIAFIKTAALVEWLPTGWRKRLTGVEAIVLLPVVVIAIWLAFVFGNSIEHLWFGGSATQWLEHNVGIDYDQRNAIIVGMAMGFAVMPTIFSIAEDAFFSVPRHLINGSLALGATSWQTVMRVILPTASPALFSAVMMGLGRAVGETMIVLMASGNTPLTDFSPLTGMRALSANIAVEMPEAEVGATHFRILFLTALLLFLFTLVLNTAAEIVRQRLRRKYSSL